MRNRYLQSHGVYSRSSVVARSDRTADSGARLILYYYTNIYYTATTILLLYYYTIILLYYYNTVLYSILLLYCYYTTASSILTGISVSSLREISQLTSCMLLPYY